MRVPLFHSGGRSYALRPQYLLGHVWIVIVCLEVAICPTSGILGLARAARRDY